MAQLPSACAPLAHIPHLDCQAGVELRSLTRFQIGGPATVLCRTEDPASFTAALGLVRSCGLRYTVIGGGSNLIVSDQGFDGIVLQFTGALLERRGSTLLAGAGALLQDVVDTTIGMGLTGLETMTGIPGNLGAAIYGNAGAYGRSIDQCVEWVEATDGFEARRFSQAECSFRYRESRFKQEKQWVILRASLRFSPGEPGALAKTACDIRAIRDAKYPPAMKCAGSIFKNLFYADLPVAVQNKLPPNLVREGKVPSAWLLEQSGVRGLRRGDIEVAPYHANLIYNLGAGTAEDLLLVIEECKERVRARFGILLEEEVQYIGFDPVPAPV